MLHQDVITNFISLTKLIEQFFGFPVTIYDILQKTVNMSQKPLTSKYDMRDYSTTVFFCFQIYATSFLSRMNFLKLVHHIIVKFTISSVLS